MSDPNDPKDPTVRKGALLLSSLVLTPDSALQAFAARPDVSAADTRALEQAREALNRIGFALRAGDRQSWQRVAQAWEILRRIPPPPSADHASPAPPPAAASPAPAPASPPPAAAPLAPAPPPRPLSPASAPAEPDALERTATVDALQIDPGAALPFAPDQAAAPPPLLPTAPRDEAGETAFVSAVPDPATALPFDSAPARAAAPASPEAVQLTLEQYASFCAEREMCAPAERAAVHRKYGLADEQAARALDGAWRARLDASAAERAELESLVARYRAWLATQRSRR